MTTPYEGLTDDELATLTAESEQRPGEDATDWARRAKADAERYATLAAKRRAEAEAADAGDAVEGAE